MDIEKKKSEGLNFHENNFEVSWAKQLNKKKSIENGCDWNYKKDFNEVYKMAEA